MNGLAKLSFPTTACCGTLRELTAVSGGDAGSSAAQTDRTRSHLPWGYCLLPLELAHAFYLEELILNEVDQEFRVLGFGSAPSRVLTPVASPSFSETGHVSCLVWCQTLGQARGTPVAWRPRGTSSLGCLLEPDSGVALPILVQRGYQGSPFVTGTVPSRGNLRSRVSSSCLGLSCPRPCCRVIGVARPQWSSGRPGVHPASHPS